MAKLRDTLLNRKKHAAGRKWGLIHGYAGSKNGSPVIYGAAGKSVARGWVRFYNKFRMEIERDLGTNFGEKKSSAPSPKTSSPPATTSHVSVPTLRLRRRTLSLREETPETMSLVEVEKRLREAADFVRKVRESLADIKLS